MIMWTQTKQNWLSQKPLLWVVQGGTVVPLLSVAIPYKSYNGILDYFGWTTILYSFSTIKRKKLKLVLYMFMLLKLL